MTSQNGKSVLTALLIAIVAAVVGLFIEYNFFVFEQPNDPLSPASYDNLSPTDNVRQKVQQREPILEQQKQPSSLKDFNAEKLYCEHFPDEDNCSQGKLRSPIQSKQPEQSKQRSKLEGFDANQLYCQHFPNECQSYQ